MSAWLASSADALAPNPCRVGGPHRRFPEVDAVDDSRVTAGQTIYVPAYSSIDHRQAGRTTWRSRSASGTPIGPSRLWSTAGVIRTTTTASLLRDYLKAFARIAPLAAMEYFVPESDTNGGYSASFLVEWVAEATVSAPWSNR